MRRPTLLLLSLLAVLSLACAGDDRSAEVDRLQVDVEALRAEVAYLSGELEIAQSERDRAQEELAQALADLERQTAAAEAAAAAVQDEPGDAPDAPAPASDAFRAYFQEVEGISQGATDHSAEIVAKIDAVARTGDLEATKALFGDLARVLEEAAGKITGLEPPPALASLHGEFAASQEGFAQAMAEYARAVEKVTTWEGFGAVVEAFPQSPGFLAAAGRSVIACFALQDAAAESGVSVELRCEGI